jgi:NET1-associated nuclear protein 1 (U3 small nucleolar RNA-associated protein 17)
VVNPDAESFIISLVPTTSKVETQFLFFDVLSSQPRSNITLPFKFITLAYYALSPLSSFHIVGITLSWKVVVFGKNLNISTVDPSKHRGIAADNTLIQKRTLFQDIFGSSAFQDTTSESKPGPSSSGTAAVVPGATSSIVSESFSSPAYLMPSMETLYDSLIGAYLGPRGIAKPTVGPEGHLQREGADSEEEDEDAMDVSPEHMVLNRDHRVVSGEEMDNLSRLFAIHAIDRESFFSWLRLENVS